MEILSYVGQTKAPNCTCSIGSYLSTINWITKKKKNSTQHATGAFKVCNFDKQPEAAKNTNFKGGNKVTIKLGGMGGLTR